MNGEESTIYGIAHRYGEFHNTVGDPCRDCESFMDSPLYGGVVRDGEFVRQYKCPGCQNWGDIDEDQFHGTVSIDCPNCEYHETINVAVMGWRTPLTGPKGFVA